MSHHIPAHKHEKKKPYYDVSEGREDGTCRCFRKRSATLNFSGSSRPQCNRIRPQLFMTARITRKQQPIPQFTTLKLVPGRL